MRNIRGRKGENGRRGGKENAFYKGWQLMTTE
jgi:hypothetical protein